MILIKWCKECGKATEHIRSTAWGMKLEVCKEHRIEPWESLYPIPQVKK